MLTDTHSLPHSPAADATIRRHPRALFSIPITMRHLVNGGVHTGRGITLDLSESGMGALVEGGLHIGDTLTVELTLPDCKLRASAIVRHSSSVRSGFEFLGLTMEERLHIANVISDC